MHPYIVHTIKPNTGALLEPTYFVFADSFESAKEVVASRISGVFKVLDACIFLSVESPTETKFDADPGFEVLYELRLRDGFGSVLFTKESREATLEKVSTLTFVELKPLPQ